jgi:uncharacterized sulfatase
MNQRSAWSGIVFTPLVALFATLQAGMPPLAADSPNVIFILADDLGYGDLGCYGQQLIKTPRLDQMASQGMRFTQFYAGCTVCAPSRSVLMTGQHTGHTWVRGNAGENNKAIQSLRDQDVTLAEMLKSKGYKTGLVGKWGLGEVEQPGFPLKQGFDYFYGYLSQVHAHNYYPEFLYRNDQRVWLGNEVKKPEGSGADFLGGSATKRVQYSHDLIAEEGLKFVRQHAQQPFFLYWALTTPHANNEATRMTGNGAEVPTFGVYANQDWPDQDKGQAAMVTRMDGDVGRMMDLLNELGISEKTLVIFSSDNGPHNEAGHNLKRFKPYGPLSGTKRSLTEGGIRVPLLAYWPGKIKPGQVRSHVGYFPDIMPTLAELADIQLTSQTDGISIVPTLLNRGTQANHQYLYWEFYEQGSRQSVRFGDWTAIRQPLFDGKIQLFNLSTDLAQEQDLAAQHPDLVAQAASYMDSAHVPHPNWQIRK